jgi:hypothetical protein
MRQYAGSSLQQATRREPLPLVTAIRRYPDWTSVERKISLVGVSVSNVDRPITAREQALPLFGDLSEASV